MATRIVFVTIALVLFAAVMWAYHHDEKLRYPRRVGQPRRSQRTVREIMGDPSSEGECGCVTLAPESCTEEYVYRYYYSILRPQYEVVWFDRSGKVIGEQHVQRP